jgi:hypothetical protein
MSNWKEPKIGGLVACETVAAVVLHVRRIADRGVKLGGHVAPRPLALCGSPVDWDTQRPVSAVHCRSCLAALAKVVTRP